MLMTVRRVRYRPVGISPGYDHVVRTRVKYRNRIVPITRVCNCSKPLSESCMRRVRRAGLERIAQLC